MTDERDSASGLIPPDLTGRHMTCHCRHVGKLVTDAEIVRLNLTALPSADELKFMVRDAKAIRRLAWIILGAVVVAIVAAVSPKISIRLNDPPTAQWPSEKMGADHVPKP